MATPTKKRRVISLELKKKLIDSSQGKRIAQLGEQFDLPRGTVQTILSGKESILKAINEGGEGNRLHLKSAKHEKLEEVVLRWVKSVRSQNVSITGPLIMEKALELSQLFNIQGFKASDGWLTNFKNRHSISFRTNQGEAGEINLEELGNWQQTLLLQTISQYSPNDVFNADETGLFWQLLPNKTLAFKGERCTSGKKSKERITVLVGSNMSGTEKLPLLIIGKSAKPRCFKNVQLPVDYKFNKKAWMTECTTCNKNNLENICRLVRNMTSGEQNGGNVPDDPHQMESMLMTAENIASDKIALIISNRTYSPQMPNLLTPHCDAESLADALQQLKFKTVTLGDLKIDEMRFIIQEYRKLFGEGIYAVFYFVGHGFEANGQCYLLPIGAPAENYGPEDCISMDWVMSVFCDCNPALNLIILDICRKFLPTNLDAFQAYAERFRRPEIIKINRNTVYGYATSGGVGAYEVRGEVNGVFMKYLKKRITQNLNVLDMLKRVFRDIEKDKKVCDVQIPELRSNLTRPRSLLDPLIFDGHTVSYDHHTMQWRLMHELPTPVHVTFADQRQLVTVWFDFCGHFTNKVYVFSNVSEVPTDEQCYDYPSNVNALIPEIFNTANVGPINDNEDNLSPQSYFAHLQFQPEFDASLPKICIDDEEGVSLCVMLSNLQRCKGELRCTLELRLSAKADVNSPGNDSFAITLAESNFVASKEVVLGHVLVTRLTSSI